MFTITKCKVLYINGPYLYFLQGIEHLYGTREPTVISQALLRAAVYAQGPKEEAGTIARVEGIEYNGVKQLALNFQSKQGNSAT